MRLTERIEYMMKVVRGGGIQEKIEGAAGVRVFATPADGMAGLSVAEVELQPGATTGEHSHDSDQLVYILNGEARFAGGEEEHHLSRGDLIYIPAGLLHRHDSVGAGTLRQLAIFVPREREPGA
jgi:quercetin dioxygenase-like cupin family protein